MTGSPPLSPQATRIATGHAFTKHVMEKGEFPEVTTQLEFAELIDRVLGNPGDTKSLAGGRTAYWEESAGVTVITDPAHPDGGTCFRPRSGGIYYDRLR